MTNRELTKKEKRIIDLAMAGGTDKELAVLETVNELEDKFDEKTSEIQDSFKEATNEVKGTLKEIREFVPDLMRLLKDVKGTPGHTPTKGELIALIEPLIPEVKDGETPTKEDLLKLITPLIPKVENGKSPTEEELVQLIKPLIPPPENGKDADETAIIAKVEADLPALGAATRDGLELLQGDERLDIKAIKGLEKIETQLKEVAGRVQTPAKSYQIRIADCSSQCNGSNKTFSVGGSHFGIVGVFSTEFPNILRPVIDYTETRTGFTLTSQVAAVASGQTLIAQYLK